MNYLLFTTTTCPRCPSFKEFINKFVKFPGKVLDERDENFKNLTLEYAVSSVPTILVFEDESLDNAVCRTGDPAELYSFLNSNP